MKKLGSFVAVFTALAGMAIAQQQPYMTVSLPVADAGVTPVMLADWAHDRMVVVYGNMIVPISVPDGTVGTAIMLPNTTETTYTGGSKSINACIDPSTGMVATVAVVNSMTGATVIQTVDPAGKVLSFTPPTDQFDSGAGCAFANGLLYSGGSEGITGVQEWTKVVSFDPMSGSIVKTWPRVGIGQFFGIASSSSEVYILNLFVQGAGGCALTYNCLTELDTLDADGTATALSQWAGPQENMPMSIGPNGWIYAGAAVLDQNGQRVNGRNLLGVAAVSVAFPSSDPWYAYVIANISPGGFLGGYDMLNSYVTAQISAANQVYLFVAASRQSDGTDLVIGLRNGSLDLYKIVPPQLIHFVANAGLFESSTYVPASSPQLAPGSIVTIYGQGLAPWGTYLGADTTKIVTQLANVSVYLDYSINPILPPLQLLFVGYNQINAVLLRNQTVTDGSHLLIVTNGTKAIGEVYVTIVNQAVADFMWSPDPTNPLGTQPIITNQLNQLIGDPSLGYVQASGGDAVTFWATGIGQTTHPLRMASRSPRTRRSTGRSLPPGSRGWFVHPRNLCRARPASKPWACPGERHRAVRVNSRQARRGVRENVVSRRPLDEVIQRPPRRLLFLSLFQIGQSPILDGPQVTLWAVFLCHPEEKVLR